MMIAEPRLLVVDDNEDNRYTLTQRLKRQGWSNVTSARNGSDALGLLATGAFDLVLLDVMMPELNGYEVLERMKAAPALRDLPVIMISAVDELDSVVRCIKLGADDYLAKPFNPVLLSARVGASLEKKRLRDEAAAHLARMESELDAAREIQLGMVPGEFPVPGPAFPAEVFATLLPARQIGGDLYDFFLVDEDTLGLVVADVSDKGTPAALFMAHTSSMIRVITSTVTRRGAPPNPASVMAQVNAEMCRVNRAAMFVTVFLATLELRTGALHFCVAGHPMPYRIGPGGGIERLGGPSGIPVGIDAAFRYETGASLLGPGECLFLYTDGVTEAMNPDRAFFGEPRLRETLAALGSATPRSVVQEVVCAVREFAGEAPQADDIAAMAVRLRRTRDTKGESHGDL